MSDGPRGAVFRDAATRTTLHRLRHAAEIAVGACHELSPSPGAIFDALLAVGDYENALADDGQHAELLPPVASIADALADLLVTEAPSTAARERLGACLAGGLACPPADRAATCKRPQGFAYDALRPAAVANGLPELGAEGPVVVVGIRTIGTTLSAIAAASLRKRGGHGEKRVLRATVRPTGHPYDRRVSPSSAVDAAVEARVRAAMTPATRFLVVDEGPGRSGSSFLAVADWLERLGATPAQIVLYGSHVPSPVRLCAPDADRRWGRLHAAAFAASPSPGVDLTSGAWRSVMALPKETWPISSSLTDREKRLQLGPDGTLVVEKFEGLGRYGQAPLRRALALAQAGWSAPVLAFHPARGSLVTPLLEGQRPLSSSFRTWAPDLVAYCAYRARDPAFAAPDESQQELLGLAAAQNAEQELGATVDPRGLRTERVIVTDGRMQPWEWVATPDGRLVKTDAVSHGDDPLLPGPTDIAWDLAGVIVEWGLEDADRAAFLAAYGVASGDRDLGRVAFYEVAYASFRAAACAMTAPAEGSPERWRHEAERARLRARGRRALARLT